MFRHMTSSSVSSVIFLKVLLHGIIEGILDQDCTWLEFTTTPLSELHGIG